MSKIKSLVFLGLALILTLSLVAVACAPKAPVGETVPKEQLTKAQADLAAEKQKSAGLDKQVKDLQAELAAAQKPAKVYRWEPCNWISAGIPFEALQEMANIVNAGSDGRIVITPSAVGAVCPIEEQTEAVSAGTTGMMLVTPSYLTGKIPCAVYYNSSLGMRTASDQQSCYEVFEEGRAQELYFSIIEKNYNVESLGTRVGPLDLFICARVPIRSTADLAGKKFRCGDEHAAVPLNMMGASTTWFPGSEIYTSLATGAIDAVTYGGYYDHYSMGFHEVAKYWVVNGKFMACANEQYLVNRDIWNEISDDLKALVYGAIRAGNDITIPRAQYLDGWALSEVQKVGVELIIWPEESVKLAAQNQMEWAQKYVDVPENAELFGIIQRFAKMKGYID